MYLLWGVSSEWSDAVRRTTDFNNPQRSQSRIIFVQGFSVFESEWEERAGASKFREKTADSSSFSHGYQ
jgi:hypothetical protein